MIIKKLFLENIRSYKSEEITFPEGSILLSGDIGAGKTSILLAIEFALFGLQPGQRGVSLLSTDSDEGKVKLEFEVSDKIISVERTLKRGSKTVSQDYSAISIDGNKEEMSVTELKHRILELLNYPSEFAKKTNILFRFTVYSPQEQMKQIILEDPETRMNIIRHIFGIDKYKRIKENASIVASKLREESRTLQGEIKGIEEHRQRIEFLEKRVADSVRNCNQKENTLKEKTKTRQNLEKEAEELEKKLDEKKRFESEVDKTKIMLGNKRSNLNDIEKEITNIDRKLSESTEVYEDKKFNEIINELTEKNNLYDSLNKKYLRLVSDFRVSETKKQENLDKKNRVFSIEFCPTCLQNVPMSHKHNILNEAENKISSSDREIKEISEKLLETEREIQITKTKITNLETEKTRLEILRSKSEETKSSNEKKSYLELTKDSLKKDIEFLESHLTTLKSSVLEFSKYSSLYESKESQLESALKEEKNIEIEIAQIKKEIEITNSEIAYLQKEIEAKEYKSEKLNRILKIENWISNDFMNLVDYTEKHIMLKIREEFSRSFNKWFILLTSESFSAHLDETFTPVIVQGGFELDYSFLSGGERTAVALAYRLALNQIISSIFSELKTKGLIILDEPTDGFSDLQLDKVRDILIELNSDQLIIVSHAQKIEGFVDNVIKLKKEDKNTLIIPKVENYNHKP